MSTISLEMTWKGTYSGLGQKPNQIAVFIISQIEVLFQATVNRALNPHQPQLLTMQHEALEFECASLPYQETVRLVIGVARKHFTVVFQPKAGFHYRLELERSGDRLSGSCKPLQYITLRDHCARAIGALDDRDLEKLQINDCFTKMAISNQVKECFDEISKMDHEGLEHLRDISLEKDGLSRERNLIGALIVAPLHQMSRMNQHMAFVKAINLAYNNQQLLHKEGSLILKLRQQAFDEESNRVYQVLSKTVHDLWAVKG